MQVRYCSEAGGDKKRRCPVSGSVLKFSRGKVTRTPDFALRNVIRHQAVQAKASPCPAPSVTYGQGAYAQSMMVEP